MTIVYEERVSDSAYVDTVITGYTTQQGSSVRPAESHWHMVFVRHQGNVHVVVVGPWTASGTASWGRDAEILWIKFRLGAFMPDFPVRKMVNTEFTLPGAARRNFWLKGTAWQFPTFENAETFIDRLAHAELIVRDPVVEAVLNEEPQDIAARTVRHRFAQATGLRQSQIHQIERAQRAADYLRQGNSILDTVHEIGYFDQPHLTRSLKQWVGHTPAQLLRTVQPEE